MIFIIDNNQFNRLVIAALVTTLFQNELNSLFSSKFYKQYPIMTMWNKLFEIFANLSKNTNREKKSVLMYISIK